MRPQDWEKPYVDIFKYFNVFKTGTRRGGAYDIQNNEIGRRVFKIQGTVPASNFVEITNVHNKNKSLGLSGRYTYIAFILEPSKPCSIHFHYTMQDGNSTKITLSTIYDKISRESATWVQVPLKGIDKWTVLCVDNLNLFTKNQILPKRVGGNSSFL